MDTNKATHTAKLSGKKYRLMATHLDGSASLVHVQSGRSLTVAGDVFAKMYAPIVLAAK